MIRVTAVSIQSGTFRLERASLDLASGAYGVLMGKTGSGKTTLLEAIAGLKTVANGQIVLGNRDVTWRKPAERNLGYVPQDGALFHTMTVRDHLAFALIIRRTRRAEVDRRVRELAEWLEIEHLLDRSTRGLSGGEKQRVAIGRAVSFRPTTLLLDEPLSALDDRTKAQMYTMLKRVQRLTGVTILHVTHSLSEAVRLADRLFRIEDGVICEPPLQAVEGAPPDGGNGPGDAREQRPQDARRPR